MFPPSAILTWPNSGTPELGWEREKREEPSYDPLAPARICAAAGAARPVEPADPVVAVAAHSAAAAPRRFPADAAVVRDSTEGRDALAHAVVAHAVALDARHPGDPRGGGTVVESAGRDGNLQGSARAPDRRRFSGRRDLGRAHAHRRGSDRAGGNRLSRGGADPDVGA